MRDLGGVSATSWRYAAQVPDADTQLGMWCFYMSTASFFTLPHFIQRIYAAGSMHALKVGYYVMSSSTWITMPIGVYVGTIGVSLLGAGANPTSPFTATIEQMMDFSGFGYFAGSLVLTSSLAAIMSTTDSLLIAISQLVSAEIFYPLKPEATPAQISLASKVVSAVSMAVALAVAMTKEDGLSALAAIQFGISLQAVPAFLFGLYGSGMLEIHPRILAGGGWAGAATCFGVYYGYTKSVTPDEFYVDSGMAGLVINIATLIIVEMVFRGVAAVRGGGVGALTSALPVSLPEWDGPSTSRFGDAPLTPRMLSLMMRGIYEPLKHAWLVPCMLVVSVAMLPLDSIGLPELGATFEPETVGGIPKWAFNYLMWNGAPRRDRPEIRPRSVSGPALFHPGLIGVFILYTIHRMPDSLEATPASTDDPDAEEEAHLMPLDLAELTSRKRYDEPSEAVMKSRAARAAESGAAKVKEVELTLEK